MPRECGATSRRLFDNQIRKFIGVAPFANHVKVHKSQTQQRHCAKQIENQGDNISDASPGVFT
jgi:hypothetical protein